MLIDVATFAYLDGAHLFSQIAQQPWAMYFDSGNTSKRPPRAETERFDLLVMQPCCTLVTNDKTTLITNADDCCSSDLDPFALVQQQLLEVFGKLDDGSDKHPYLPGAYGYFSYDLARRFEQLPEIAENDEQLPEMAIGIYPVVLMIDHQQRCTKLISMAGFEELKQQWLDLLSNQMTQNDAPHAAQPLRAEAIQANQTRAEYNAKFAQVRTYTIEGDCYQVNLTKRFHCAVEGDGWSTYQRLRYESPAPYGAYLHLPFAEVLSNSPESFIRCRQGQVTTQPIKGTRPRDHHNPARDKKLARELASSEKDQAENLMIVDLMRNDLSRCCELGSVNVPKLFSLHTFANVHHLISTISGRLKPKLHALDLLRACFPGGSITGAPKIRAMEIIEELEPHRRGLYCGSVAYVGADGNLETSIAIRTIVVKDGVARFSAGGGVVIDSKEADEYQELLDKAKMMRAMFSD